jgi:hypothetical protein
MFKDDPKPESEQGYNSAVTLTCACSRCDKIMELQIVIGRCGDQPAYKIFRCGGCGAFEWIEL